MKLIRVILGIGSILTLILSLGCPGGPTSEYDPEAFAVEVSEPPADICVPPGTTVTLGADAVHYGTSIDYSWSVDNSNATIANPDEPSISVLLTEPGTYVFTVIGTNFDGDDESDTRTITVDENCEFTVQIDSPYSSDVFAVGQDVYFASSQNGGSAPFAFEWEFGDGSGIPASAEQFPTVSYPTEGPYTVTVTVTDADDVEAAASVDIEIADYSSIPMPVTNVMVIAPAPPNFGGSTTPDGGTMVFSSNSAGAALLDSDTGAFGPVILPGNSFEGAAIARSTAGVEAIAGVRGGSTFVSIFDPDSGEFPIPTPLIDERGYDIQLRNPASGSLVAATASGVQVYELGERAEEYAASLSVALLQFPGIDGNIRSAVGRPADNAFLACSSGSPTQLYLHDGGPGNDAVLIGELGANSIKLRGIGDVYCAIDTDDDLCYVITWDAGNNVSIVGSFPTGSSPRGYDLKLLGNGNYGCVIAAFGYPTITVAEIGPNGTIINSEIKDLPIECGQAMDAMWAEDGSTYVLVPSLASGELFTVPTGL